jgi:hypothetical protein
MEINTIGYKSFWYLLPLPLKYLHVTIKFIKVNIDEIVEISNEANAQSTGAPVYLL